MFLGIAENGKVDGNGDSGDSKIVKNYLFLKS